MKMRPWWIATAIAVTVSTSSCVPVPAYPVDAYVGSLDKCLDIQGTYEGNYFYRKENAPGIPYLINNFLPNSFMSNLYKAESHEIETNWRENEKIFFKKVWVNFEFSDRQRIKITVFTEDGQSLSKIVDMNDKKKYEINLAFEDEDFVCNPTSWQESRVRMAYQEGGRKKLRSKSLLTRTANGALKNTYEYDSWRGMLGLYMREGGGGNLMPESAQQGEYTTYHRKVDLTVDDIRANNEKAKKAIAQYDEVATSPPPAN